MIRVGNCLRLANFLFQAHWLQDQGSCPWVLKIRQHNLARSSPMLESLQIQHQTVCGLL